LASLGNHKFREISGSFQIFMNSKDYFRTQWEAEINLPDAQLACETDSLIKISELLRENRALRYEIVGLKETIRKMEDDIRTTLGGRFQIERVFSRTSSKDFLGQYADLATSNILKLEDFAFISHLFPGDFGLKLLYRSSRDVARANHFHRLCDGQGPTIVFAKSGKYIAGGFTDISWQGPETGIYCKTANAFLFSLTRRRRYPVIEAKDSQAIHCYEYAGPCFGFDFCIGYEIHSPTSYSHGNRVFDFGDAEEPSHELFGSLEFTVEECEVYHVSIN
jgi:hypothetical protein